MQKLKSLLTFDIHRCDTAKDISYATKWLTENNIPAVYFVPTELLEIDEFLNEIKTALSAGIEIGTHGHHHNKEEIFALINGTENKLQFLEKSKDIYLKTLDKEPKVFRSPHWCPISNTAYKKLSDLGYTADFSPTPQRLSIFSSLPYTSTWLFSKRQIHFNDQKILVIPTSSFIFPLGNPTFSIFRKYASLLFLQFFKVEVSLTGGKIINIMFHVGDLHNKSHQKIGPNASLSMLLPKRFGGFGFKSLFRQVCVKGLANTTHCVINSLRNAHFCSFDEIYTNHVSSELDLQRQRMHSAPLL